jgi:hypothetical protein
MMTDPDLSLHRSHLVAADRLIARAEFLLVEQGDRVSDQRQKGRDTSGSTRLFDTMRESLNLLKACRKAMTLPALLDH